MRGASRARWGAIVVLLVLASAAPGCAAEADPDWRPPTAVPVAGVTLMDAHDDGSASQARTGSTSTPDQAGLGLALGRLRNDALPLAARYVLVPGVPAFNERVLGIVREAIAASGVPYAPQAFPAGAGLGDRGCVPGSTSWPAAEVLNRPETGPAGGAGTAVTCELLSAFGELLGVGVRVVSGSAETVTADRTVVLYANVRSGAVIEAGSEWSDTAPGELWVRAVDLLRHRAGALSAAPVAAPDEQQLRLAAGALATARHVAGGSAVVTLPAGIASPELAGLGIEATDAPMELSIDAETVLTWSSEQRRALLAASAEPFVGLGAPATSVPIDCALVPCVAITYDDGPSNLTPTLLDTLHAEQASATFFLIGRAASGSPGTVQRILAEGHELGSHTMSHPDLTRLPLAEARAQVRDAAAAIERVSGAPVRFFRPPYGAVNTAVISAVGMPAILWTVDTNDWREPGEAVVVQRAVDGAAPGGIVLFHDTHADTVAAADDVVRGLRDRGFEPVTVSELFGGAVPPGRVSGR